MRLRLGKGVKRTNLARSEEDGGQVEDGLDWTGLDSYFGMESVLIP
jgi:hypothetical protein